MWLGAVFKGILRPVGKVINAIAAAGHEVIDQYNLWLASESRGDPRVRWVFVQCGINNILHGTYTAAQIIAQMATLIGDIQTQNPDADIYLAKMDPAKFRLDIVTGTGGPNRYTQWVDVNAGYAAAHPAIWLTTISDALNDGADNLDAAYDSGDGLHPNTTGDAIAVDDLKAWAVALPGGWS